MTEKTFEELFPDLNRDWEIIGNEKRSIAYTGEIRKACLSKQRVKEAFQDLIATAQGEDKSTVELEFAMRGLGLDNE